LVRWHAGAVSFPLSDVILAQLACPLSDVKFCLHSGITNLSLYKQILYMASQTFTLFPCDKFSKLCCALQAQWYNTSLLILRSRVQIPHQNQEIKNDLSVFVFYFNFGLTGLLVSPYRLARVQEIVVSVVALQI
jgi:hypothetical protein